MIPDWEDHDIGTYILDADHRPVKAKTLEWARWYETADRQVAKDKTKLFIVSTVFLGLDHSWGKGPPILFETMVFERQRTVEESFGGRLISIRNATDEMERYASWDDALTGHQTILRRVQKLEADAVSGTPATKPATTRR